MRLLLSLSLLIAAFPATHTAGDPEILDTSSTRIADICSAIPAGMDMEDWLVGPDHADELVTAFGFTHLGGALIQSGLAEAGSCTDGGMLANDKASPCGMAQANAEVVAWQNIFNQAIYQAALDTHVPAYLLKGLFAQESQFWPASKLDFEYGLGHLTRSGVETALVWSPELYGDICRGTLGKDCHQSGSYFDYLTEEFFDRDTLLAATIAQINPDCPQCTGGIDPIKAQASVRIFGWSLLAHCRQATQVMYNATGHIPLAVTDYPTLWKLGLYSYNAGSGCLYETLVAAWSPGEILSWEQFASSTTESCRYGIGYVERVLDYAVRMGDG